MIRFLICYLFISFFTFALFGQEVALDSTAEKEIVTLAERSRNAQAKSHYRRAERFELHDEVDQAIEELNQAIALRYNFQEALLLRARLHKRNSDFTDALTDYQSLIYIAPERIEPRFDRAQLFYRLERYQEAIDDFRYLLENELGETTTVYFRGISESSANGQSTFTTQSATTVQSGMKADIWNFMGLCYLELEKYEKAIFFFELALTQHSQDPNVNSNLGLAFEHMGDTLKAINSYRKALLLDPNHSEALQNFSYLSRKYDRLDIAESTFTQISKGEISSKNLLHPGMVLHQSGEYQRAIATYSAAIPQSPNNPDIYLQRGFSRDKSGQYQDALLDYTQAIRLNSSLEKAYVNRGNVYYKLRKFDAAERDYLSAIRLSPHNPKTYYNLGLVYHRRDQLAEACQYLSQALELGYYKAKEVINKVCNNQ